MQEKDTNTQHKTICQNFLCINEMEQSIPPLAHINSYCYECTLPDVSFLQCSTATIFGLEAQGTWNAEKEKDVIADLGQKGKLEKFPIFKTSRDSFERRSSSVERAGGSVKPGEEEIAEEETKTKKKTLAKKSPPFPLTMKECCVLQRYTTVLLSLPNFGQMPLKVPTISCRDKVKLSGGKLH